MKKYLKMTFTALSAIALNFSCLAMDSQQSDATEQNSYEVIRIYYNTSPIRDLTPLSTEEEIMFLERAISAPDPFLVMDILIGYIGKADQEYFYTSEEERFPITIPSKNLEDLQLLALNAITSLNNTIFYDKCEIFELITSEFYKVENNKKYVCKTTASRMYSNLYRFESWWSRIILGELVNLLPSPNSKRAFVKQFLNDANRNNDINAYEKIFSALDPKKNIDVISNESFSIFENQPWLQPFISEYLEQAQLDVWFDMPIYFIKKAAPDLYNEKFFTFLEKCIIEDFPNGFIDVLLPRYRHNRPFDVRKLPLEYLNLALENFNTHFHEDDSRSEHILSHIALYTDTSSDLTNIALTLTSFTQEKRQETLECIKDANSGLHNLILEKLQSLEY